MAPRQAPGIAGGIPAAIEAHEVSKSFHIPTHRVETLKERVVRPFSAGDYRELRALRDVSFEVGRGEFFGIVGRNGSGKSTLLKILASIYAADRGEVRVDGQIAPFIELGVGFNPDLTARENVVLNGVMVGLARREAERRLWSVVEFAELEDFVDLKLKNYSSGMLVRLAFAVMLQSDADILLVDEVLAVGDEAFKTKCRDCFDEMNSDGRTIVLVTHSMDEVERFCDRALLLRGGRVDLIGAPAEVARRYEELNLRPEHSVETEDEGGAEGTDASAVAAPAVAVEVADAWLQRGGERCASIESGEEGELHVVFEAKADLRRPKFALTVAAGDVDVFGFGAELDSTAREVLRAGERVDVSGRFANRLAPGRYAVKCWVTCEGADDQAMFHSPRALGFAVTGTEYAPGLVTLAEESAARLVEREPQAL